MTFIAHLQPSRQDVPEYVEYLEKIEALVAVINHRHGTTDWMPIDLRLRDDFDEAVALYKHFDLLLVNAMWDGMNLVSKEGPLVNTRDGMMILSENTGAHEELGACALSVNPFDVQEQADAMYRALTASAGGARSAGCGCCGTSSSPARRPTGSTTSSPTSRRSAATRAGDRRRAPLRGRTRRLRRGGGGTGAGGAGAARRRGAATGWPVAGAGAGDAGAAWRRAALRRRGAGRGAASTAAAWLRADGAAAVHRLGRRGCGRHGPPSGGSAARPAAARDRHDDAARDVQPPDTRERSAAAATVVAERGPRRDQAAAAGSFHPLAKPGERCYSRRRSGPSPRHAPMADKPNYDLMVLLDPEAPEERRAELIEQIRGQIQSGDATLKGDADWGMRRLAYEIDHRAEAQYHLFQFEAVPDVLSSLDRSLSIEDAVLRFRTIRLPGEAPEETPPAPPQTSFESGRGRPRGRDGGAAVTTAARPRRSPARGPHRGCACAGAGSPRRPPAAEAPDRRGPPQRRRSRGRRRPRPRRGPPCRRRPRPSRPQAEPPPEST